MRLYRGGVVTSGGRPVGVGGGEAGGGEDEDNCRPSGEACQNVGGAARAGRGLRALSSECSGEIRRLALLQKHNADEKQADDDVKNDEQSSEHGTEKPS